MKRCSQCKLNLDLSKFFVNSLSPDGFRSECKVCRSRYLKEYQSRSDVKRRRKISLAKYVEKKNKIILERLKSGCIDCGEKNIVVLEFDHQFGKINNISNLRKHGKISDLIIELQKCNIRCANCHKRKTATEFNWWKK